jgi:hypothetical protein
LPTSPAPKVSSTPPKPTHDAKVHEKNEKKANRTANTLLFLRVHGKEDKFPTMKLGDCLSINDFFAKIAYHIQETAQSILQVAIRLPSDIGMLDEYVLQMGAGHQPEFEKLVKILSDAVIDLDSSTVPVQYILTVTIAVR